MSNRMYLRVKRRRSSAISSTIRLEGLDSRKRVRERNLEDEVSDLRISATIDAPEDVDPQPQSRRRRAAVWKRIDLNDTVDKKRSVHLVEALLEDDPEADSKQSVKRRRLTLLDTDADSKDYLFRNFSAKKTKVGYKVLDPLQRLVDDSLQKVHTGELSIDQHVQFIRTDPNLAPQSRQWLAWCHSSSGNLLHACASWNNVEVASELLSLGLDGLADAEDQQGLTPYEIADLSGHQQICDVLEAFGADPSNYVFDIYCLDDTDENNEESESKRTNEQTSMELQGGVGYWNEEGQLILEMPTTAGESADNDEDEDDDDSNDEGWGGNDYPDEDAGAWVDNDEEEDRPHDTFRVRPAKDEDAAAWDDDDGEEEDRPDNSFRMRPAKPYEENDDGAFDASYGISEQPEPEYDAEI